mmetsp:Transcript_21012/g.51644  ORF Transcript_21012/g.51644 Transcript_21012/m.51644 type:complete len:179 (+) Transcript_21012:1290-1826(+)|eukprot:CAMPEP_0113634988 /NCGR_PEP_ID=MMETSP0017_2-20120614/18227_1 /TAXON_ID=2856 /ORGANISM="Cylindrotheca closterium" /LENGTH=178 /DNA_ID=CAMNT_0000545727 /DNA_START=128 /DNA_END=661 /DNA_ORIENTATION=- /assembly_acc=CAM_ASM_000147
MLMAQLSSAVYSGTILISPDIPAFPQSSLPQPPTSGIPPPTILVPSPSSNAARLLVEPKGGSFSRMVNPESFRNNLALQQLFQQRALQDSRLEQCEEEQQEDFEQCFFYGTGGIDRMDGMGLVAGGGGGLVGARYPSNAGLVGASTTTTTTSSSSTNNDGRDSSAVSRKTTKTAVPTW